MHRRKEHGLAFHVVVEGSISGHRASHSSKMARGINPGSGGWSPTRLGKSSRSFRVVDLIAGEGPISTVYTGPVPPNSLRPDEIAVRDEFRIHYGDLDPAVGGTRLFAVARNARVGFAKTPGARDGRRGNSGLHQEVADSFGATL